MRDLYKISIWLWVLFIIACTRNDGDVAVTEEIATAKPTSVKCYAVCDVTKNPDLQLVTNAQEVRPLLPDGQVDSFSYFYTKYHVRTQPIRLVQNYLTTGRDAIRYGWDSNIVVNRVTLQCLVENIAPFSGCFSGINVITADNGKNDWVFNESQGYLSPLNNYFFDGLFSFETYEKGNGNNWKLLYIDYKKEWFPSSTPNVDNIYNNNFCYYDRAVQAQMGDFYFNWFRFPNHDGVYRLTIKFNPLIKGCRAVKETNYVNNEVTIILEIKEGQVIIISTM